MSKKLFRALRYVKNKPVEISVGVSPEKAAQDNVGDDKAKLVFTTDRRIFLNGEEIARTKGDERPKPIINKAIPRFPMKGSRYVVRYSNVKQCFYLNIIVAKNVRCDSEEVINISTLEAKLQEIFGEEILPLHLTGSSGEDGGVGYGERPYKTSFTAKELNVEESSMNVIAQYAIYRNNYNHNFFVLRMLSNNILNPDFELENYDEQDSYDTPDKVLKHPKFENEPCASPDYAIMNGNLFCVKMPNVKDSYVAEGKGTMPPDMIEAKNTHNVYYFLGKVDYKTGDVCPHHIDSTLRHRVWVRHSHGGLTMKRKPYRFYAIKKHGRIREQSIHFVEFKYHRSYEKGQRSIKK